MSVKFVKYEMTLPLNFVNAAKVDIASDVFFVTFGTSLPQEIHTMDDLQHMEFNDVQPTFRCAMTRETMGQVLTMLQDAYDIQAQRYESSGEV